MQDPRVSDAPAHTRWGQPPARARQHADITQHEIDALTRRHNLADAHTHQRQSFSQQLIVESLPQLWYESETRLQRDLERDFVTAFFELQGQPTALRTGRPLLAYAASISTMVVATYLMQRKLTVALIEPCFDKLHDLLNNLGVPMAPLPEQDLADVGRIYDNLCRRVTSDALFLVDPNNPTGFTLLSDGRRAFEEVVRFCVERNKLLIIDRCFTTFAMVDEAVDWFDLYELLESSGVSYLVIEDTGKTWPVQDAKCAILMSSGDLYPAIYDIHTSVLLNVSPFILNMLTRYLEDSKRDGLRSVRAVLETNRAVLADALARTRIQLHRPRARVSVAWLDLGELGIDASGFQQRLLAHDVYVLTGNYFFWSDPRRGDRFVRVALAREPSQFAVAAAKLAEEALRHGQ